MKYNYYGLEVLVMFLLSCAVMFGLYIGMVLEPECEQKGYAGVDSNGCFIIKKEKKVYEKTK